MKKYITILLSATYIFSFAQKNNLTINISNVQLNTGTVRVGVFNKQNFMSKNLVTASVLPAKNANISISFSLPKGEYALAISQDYNENTVLDKNFLGIPQEPYVFSNSVRPKFRAPTFEEAKFFVDDKKTTLQNLKLESW